jgi:hypothetical protein
VTLERWTRGEYRLVVVTEDLDFDDTRGELTARRVGERQGEPGNNLFVRLTRTKVGGIIYIDQILLPLLTRLEYLLVVGARLRFRIVAVN